jgi:hypothetical protein
MGSWSKMRERQYAHVSSVSGVSTGVDIPTLTGPPVKSVSPDRCDRVTVGRRRTFISEDRTTGPMARQQSVSRRTVLRTFGTVAAVTAGGSTASATREGLPAESDERADTGEAGTEMTGFYSGTVDRVVDGEHVVILVESGGSVVDQHVVPSEAYPSLEEGDSVYLLVVFGQVLAIWEVPSE